MQRKSGFLAVLAALLGLTACAPPPVSHELSIAFPPGEGTVNLATESRFALKPASPAIRQRVESARAAALNGTDEWAVRFGRLATLSDELTFRREGGQLESVRRAATIDAGTLQNFFADMNVTVSLIRRDGFAELAFYPGASGRAPREVQRRFDTELASWSGAVVRYLTAIDHLYDYMDEAPHRAEPLFAVLVEAQETGARELLQQEEEPLVDAVFLAMEEIAQRLDAQSVRATTLAEDADMVLNPFPARVTISLPGEPSSSEGFHTDGKGRLTIEPVDLIAGLAQLEGRWVSPDPLAAVLRDEVPTAAELATMPRRSASHVSASDVAAAVRESAIVANEYSVTWRY